MAMTAPKSGVKVGSSTMGPKPFLPPFGDDAVSFKFEGCDARGLRIFTASWRGIYLGCFSDEVFSSGAIKWKRRSLSAVANDE